MKIYLASGFSVMNIKNRERELFEKVGLKNRLISYYDYLIGNNIMQVINLKMDLKIKK